MLILVVTLVLLCPGGTAVRITGPPDVRVATGSNVTLVCEGEGALEWRHEREQLTESGRTFLPRRGVLMVIGATLRDAGLYTCTNLSSSDHVQLTVAPSEDDHSAETYDVIRSSVVGGVVGVGVVLMMVVLAVYALVLCVYNKDKVSDDGEIDYEMKEEYVATLNVEALERLDPEVRSHMDLDFLARLTNTDPALLAKYKVEPPHEAPVEQEESSCATSPGRMSLASVYQVYVDLSRQLKPSELPGSPACAPLRKPAPHPGSPAPSLHRQPSNKSFTSVDLSRESVGDRQSFLRMLKLVPLQHEADED